MNWRCGVKVFRTESEAQDFSRALSEMGILRPYEQTTAPVTHIHIGNGETREV